jgi:integrase/recombinase XerD
MRYPSLNRPHNGYLADWQLAMENGWLGGRPFSPKTSKAYLHYVGSMLHKYGEFNESTFKKALLAYPIEQFASRDKCYKASVCFAKFLIEEGVLDEGLLGKLKRYRPKRHMPPRRIALRRNDIDKLLAVCESTLETLLILLLCTTSVRASEACALTLSDIDLENGILTIRCGKGGKSRRLGISSQTLAVLQRFIQEHRVLGNASLFLNRFGAPMDRHGLHKRLQRIGEKAGVKVHPHALRRSFATINANEGKPLQMLQIALGHSNIQTTRNYCLTDEEEVIAAMKTW